MKTNFLDIFGKRELLVELVKREIKARYKQSILGYAWVILVPLANLVVLTIVFSSFVKLPTGGIPYPLFLFTAFIPWTFTANAIIAATNSLSSNSSLITKVYLPREVFPLAAILSKLVDMFLSLLVFCLFLIYYKVPLHPTIAFLPLIFFFQFLLVIGISLILSAINVFYRDVENVIGVFLTIWMYLTPVIYPPEIIPRHLMQIFNLNPMMPIINSYRNIILYGVNPPTESFIIAAISSSLIFLFGYFFFKNRAKYFADVI